MCNSITAVAYTSMWFGFLLTSKGPQGKCIQAPSIGPCFQQALRYYFHWTQLIFRSESLRRLKTHRPAIKLLYSHKLYKRVLRYFSCLIKAWPWCLAQENIFLFQPLHMALLSGKHVFIESTSSSGEMCGKRTGNCHCLWRTWWCTEVEIIG